MIRKLFGVSVVLSLLLSSGASFAEKKKMEKLKPADAPCLMLLDDAGNETNVPGNPPCEMGGVVYKPGDTVSAAAMEKRRNDHKATKGNIIRNMK